MEIRSIVLASTKYGGESVAREVRDLLTELAFNAIDHGKAKRIRLQITPKCIELLDDGEPFDSRLLVRLSEGGGGKLCATTILHDHRDCVLFDSEYIDGMNRNRLALILAVKDIHDFTSCTVELSWGDVLKDSRFVLKNDASCNVVYIILPEFIPPSIIRRARFDPEPGKEYVVVGSELSKATIEKIRETFPGSRLINLRRK